MDKFIVKCHSPETAFGGAAAHSAAEQQADFSLLSFRDQKRHHAFRRAAVNASLRMCQR